MSDSAVIRWTRAPAAWPRPSSNRSLVAGVNAEFRAWESRRPAGERILFDPWAHLFTESDPVVRLLRKARFLWPALGRVVDEQQTVHCVRHRSIDELLLRAVDRGYRQVVVVGSGYDMRASRFAPRLAGVRWIEADHPDTLERKWRLIRPSAGLNLEVELVAVDLVRQPLLGRLEAGGFDPDRPACFVLEGLIHYLPQARLEALLAALGGSRSPVCILMSYITTEMYDRASTLFVRLVRALGEVPRLHFRRSELAGLCARFGLRRFEDWDLAGQVAAFAPEARGRATGLSQQVALVSNGSGL
jgi:methyltransferase (TIGR00027 family)